MEKKILKVGEVDRSGRPLTERFIHFWNETTPAEVENIQLKDQVNSLIKNNDTVNLILEKLKPVSKFFNEPVADVTATKKRISKKERERLELEDYEMQLELKALRKVRN